MFLRALNPGADFDRLESYNLLLALVNPASGEPGVQITPTCCVTAAAML